MATHDKYWDLFRIYRIQFDGPIPETQWPSNHRRTFHNIKKIKNIEFQRYEESIRADSELHPWRDQIRRRAERIAIRATRCRESRKNETDWRLSVESEVLVRFTVEVAWYVDAEEIEVHEHWHFSRDCRARLWRSEIEASLDANDQFSHLLEERRQRRVPCHCKSMRWGENR